MLKSLLQWRTNTGCELENFASSFNWRAKRFPYTLLKIGKKHMSSAIASRPKKTSKITLRALQDEIESLRARVEDLEDLRE